MPDHSFQYHLWFNLKVDVPADEAIPVVRRFLDEQLASRRITSFRLLRNTADAPNSPTFAYLALIEFSGRDHFSAGFAKLRTDGIHEGFHGKLMQMVENFRIELTESLG